jgi:hypothetical protein
MAQQTVLAGSRERRALGTSWLSAQDSVSIRFEVSFISFIFLRIILDLIDHFSFDYDQICLSLDFCSQIILLSTLQQLLSLWSLHHAQITHPNSSLRLEIYRSNQHWPKGKM